MLSERKAMDAGKRPAFHDGHAAPLIQILAWLFLAFSTLAVVAQFATKKAMSRRLVAANFVLLAALVSIPGLRQDIDTVMTLSLGVVGGTSRDTSESCWSGYREHTSWPCDRSN